MKRNLLLVMLMVIGGGLFAQNLITNGDFESGTLTPWAGFKNGVAGVAETTPYAGDYSGRADSHDASLLQSITVEAGETYEVTFYCKWAVATSQTFTFAVKEETGNKAKYFQEDIVFNGDGTEWTENKMTFTATTESSVRLIWYKPQVSPNYPKFYLDNVSCIKQTATSIENTVVNFSVTPNPTTTSFTITSANELVNFEVFGTSGQMVKKGSLANNTATVDLSAFAKGLYFVKVTDVNNHTAVKKVLKK